MRNYYLAIDIGASSGRHILGHMEDGKMRIQEVYRFENGMQERQGHLHWDLAHLFDEILCGMEKCKEQGTVPTSLSIDTWAVDYVLLDKEGQPLGNAYGYRDSRTDGMDEAVYEAIPEQELYARTGIQKQSFNTVYQLMADKRLSPGILDQSETFLMLPDYFQYLLTGVKSSEYTNATSTQLVSPITKQWDQELIRRLSYPVGIFLPLEMPGTAVGRLKPEVCQRVGFDCEVAHCASHDTASAVMAVPCAAGDAVYISSGTWSLMGVESRETYCDEGSRLANFTNEGGYDGRFRYLKNIMGLWMIQSVRHEMGDRHSFAELCGMAEENRSFPSRVDVNDDRFLVPSSMIGAIQEYCGEMGLPCPETPGEIAAVVYQSLADCYGHTLRELQAHTGKEYDAIQIVGGGANASYLNQLTANATGKKVYAGPTEATAIGNLMAQMIQGGELAGLQEGRQCVLASFPIMEYEPQAI